MMDCTIETPTVGEILREEFMEPMNISAYKLAQDIMVPVSRIQDILHGLHLIDFASGPAGTRESRTIPADMLAHLTYSDVFALVF